MNPEDEALWADLMAAINALPSDQGRVMHMRFVDGMRPADIAKQRGVSVQEIETLIAQALEALQPVINPTIH